MNPSLKQLRDITTWDPVSTTQSSQCGVHTPTQRSHTQGLKCQKAPKRHTPEYRHTHPRGIVLWLAKSTQIKYSITHNSAQRLKEIKCTQTAPASSHVAIHNPKLPDTLYSPGRDTKLRDLSLDKNCMHLCK